MLYYHTIWALKNSEGPKRVASSVQHQVTNLIVLYDDNFSSSLPSVSVNNATWKSTFRQIVELRIHDPKFEIKIREILNSTTEDWIILCEGTDKNIKLMGEFKLKVPEPTYSYFDVN